MPYFKRQRLKNDRYDDDAYRPHGNGHFKPVPRGTDSAFFFSGKSHFPLPAFQRYWQSSLPHLLLFAGRRISALSELPWNYIHTNTFFYEKQNVFFTLFIGYLGFCAIEYFREKQTLQFFSVLGLFGVSFFFQADYGWKGFIFLLIMYTLHRERTAQAIIGSCWLAYEWKACFAFLSINMYNGKRGFIKGKGAKYFFYAFYPLHLTLLIFIRQYLL